MTQIGKKKNNHHSHQTTGTLLLKCPGGPYPPKKTLKNEMSPAILITKKKVYGN